MFLLHPKGWSFHKTVYMKHFKLTSETKINTLGIKLFRIECIIDCKWAKVGDKGGWIEKENNLFDDAWVSDNACVYGDAKVFGNAWVYGDAKVSSNADYCCFQEFGSDSRTTTVFKTPDGVRIKCGCFYGSLEDFVKQVEKTHGDNKFGREYRAIIEVIKAKFDL